jgi:hypothetical protein
VADLHALVLAELDRVDPHRPTNRALRAAVELHAPVPYHETSPNWLICHGCDMDGYEAERPPSPCSTIQAVARELGIDTGGDRGPG